MKFAPLNPFFPSHSFFVYMETLAINFVGVSFEAMLTSRLRIISIFD